MILAFRYSLLFSLGFVADSGFIREVNRVRGAWGSDRLVNGGEPSLFFAGARIARKTRGVGRESIESSLKIEPYFCVFRQSSKDRALYRIFVG